MDSTVLNFIYIVATIVGGIVFLKVFFSLWGLLDKRWHPDKRRATPETAFSDLKSKLVTVQLKSGSILDGYVYVKTLYFNDGEMAMNTCVYFQFSKDNETIFISGTDISVIKNVAA